MEEEVVHTRGTPEFLDRRRRMPDKPKKSFEATQMWDIYQEIARRIVVGQKNVEIANDLGVSSAMVSYVRNSPIVQEKISGLQERADIEATNIAGRIKAIAPDALNLLEQIIKDGKVDNEKIPAAIRAKHAENLLDRAGHSPPKEIRSLNLHGHFTLEEVEAMKQRALSKASNREVVVSE
jgi:hypothetical protein